MLGVLGAAPMGASLPGWVLAGCGWWCGAVLMLQWYSEPAKLCSPGTPLPPCPPACTLPTLLPMLPMLPCFAVENPAHCEFPLLRDLLIR